MGFGRCTALGFALAATVAPSYRSKDRKIHHEDTKITKNQAEIVCFRLFFASWCSLW